MGMLLIVPKQSEMDDQLGAPLNIKNHFIYEEECIFLGKCFMVFVLFLRNTYIRDNFSCVLINLLPGICIYSLEHLEDFC